MVFRVEEGYVELMPFSSICMVSAVMVMKSLLLFLLEFRSMKRDDLLVRSISCCELLSGEPSL